MRFEVHIIGCGAALPLPGRNPTAQVINVHEKQFLFDCGEGTQIAMRNDRIRMMRIDHIAISHLHGDHYFGLFGLLSTYSLLGRTRELNLYGPPGLEALIKAQEAAGETVRSYAIRFHTTEMDKPKVLFEDATVQLESFPVRHRIPTTGFLIREKPRIPGVKRDWVKRWQLQPTEILALLISAYDPHNIPLWQVIVQKPSDNQQKQDSDGPLNICHGGAPFALQISGHPYGLQGLLRDFPSVQALLTSR